MRAFQAKPGDHYSWIGKGGQVDHNADSTLGDDIGSAVTDLNGHDSQSCVDSKHLEKVDDWVSAPDDVCHDQGSLDLAPDLSVGFLCCCCCQADQELIDNVGEQNLSSSTRAASLQHSSCKQ